jgi:hypothetical protein
LTTKGELLRKAREQVEAEAPTAPEQPNAAEPKPTLIEAVKQVLADRGRKTMPSEIVTQLKERFDLEIKPHYASKLRTQILGKRKKKPAAPKEQASPAPTPAPAEPVALVAKTVLFDDILALRQIVDRVGMDEVRTLLDMMTGR